MVRAIVPTRLLVVCVLLTVLFVTPAAAHPGAEAVTDVVFNAGPPADVGPECAWWWPWC